MLNRVAVALVAAVIAAPVEAQNPADEAALRNLPVAFVAAWAARDATALGAIMTDDVDFVNVAAMHVKGRPDLVKLHAGLFAGRFKNSTNTLVDSSVRFLRPDIALVHWHWKLTGDLGADGTPRPFRSGLMTLVAEKTAGKWLIAATQNTDAMPPPSALPPPLPLRP